MPLYYPESIQRINECHKQLAEITTAISQDQAIIDATNAIQAYYNTSLSYAKTTKAQSAIIKNYEEYIKQLTDLKNSTATRKNTQDMLQATHDHQYISMIFANCYKMCELSFWAATAITLYSAIFLVALPMLIVQPTLGLAVSITVGGLLLKTAKNCIDCFSEFKTSSRHNEALNNKLHILSFFNPQLPEIPPDNEEQCLLNVSPKSETR